MASASVENIPAVNEAETRPQISPLARLQVLSARAVLCRESEHGIGYHLAKDGKAELIFSNLEGQQHVSVPTPLTEAQFNKIMERILPLPETLYMLHELAKAYSLGTPIMLEGGTGLGKTFVVNTFAKLLYGPRAEIPDFYCSGQTDVSELMGKYVPAGIKPQDQQRIDTFLISDGGAALKAELKQEGGGKYEITELYQRALIALGIPFKKGSFEFQLGVLPKAMTATVNEHGELCYSGDGDGVMLHIQEVGLAAPGVINALLKIRGDGGKLASSIQVWEDGGRRIEAGKGFFVVFSTNPPGKGFNDRFPVDKALARFVVWVNLPDRLSDESIRKATAQICTFKQIADGDGTILDLKNHQELGQAIGDVLAKFHKIYVEMLEKGEPGRQQKVPATLDSLWRAAGLIQAVQIPTSDLSSVDILATIRAAVQGVYINALQDKRGITPEKQLKEAKLGSLGEELLRSFDNILTGTTLDPLTGTKLDMISFRGKQTTSAEVLKTLTTEAMRASAGGQGRQTDVDDVVQAAADRVAFLEICRNLFELRKNHGASDFESILSSALASLAPELAEELRAKLK